MIFQRRVGEYTLVSRLGGGRYGVCYLAQNARQERVVLKRFRARMRRRNSGKNHHEAVILSGLSNDAVPELLGVLNVRQGYFFVLAFKPGLTLEKLLFRQHRKFTQAGIFRIGTQLLDVVSYLHRRGVVHRDIGISNVLDDGVQISLIDFGLARYADAERAGFGLDYFGVGNLLLYLLYSDYRGKRVGAWYDELPLPEPKRRFLKRMMGLDEPFSGTEEVCRSFAQCFRPIQV